MFDAATVPVTRYRWRIHTIPTLLAANTVCVVTHGAPDAMRAAQPVWRAGRKTSREESRCRSLDRHYVIWGLPRFGHRQPGGTHDPLCHGRPFAGRPHCSNGARRANQNNEHTAGAPARITDLGPVRGVGQAQGGLQYLHRHSCLLLCPAQPLEKFR